jgi:uncharacterized protein
VKDARYLIRIANSATHQPSEQAGLLDKARSFAGPIKGKAINLRVSPMAIEFDLFCSPETDTSLFQDAFKLLGVVITCKRLDLLPAKIEPQKVIDEARRLFNEYRFWEVHEVLEGLWKELAGSEKKLVQGLILIAAALVHAQKDEHDVMWKMLADALKRLEAQPDMYYEWNIGQFRKHFERVLAAKKLQIPTV